MYSSHSITEQTYCAELLRKVYDTYYTTGLTVPSYNYDYISSFIDPPSSTRPSCWGSFIATAGPIVKRGNWGKQKSHKQRVAFAQCWGLNTAVHMVSLRLSSVPVGAGQLSSNQPGLICQIVNIFSSAQSLNLTLNKRAFIEEWLCLRNFNRFTIHFELVVKTSAY